MQHKKLSLEVLRSGFLSDGRFYSLEVSSLSGGRWEAGIACVPGDRPGQRRSPTLLTTISKDVVRTWAATLTAAEIERFVETYYPVDLPAGSPEPERVVEIPERIGARGTIGGQIPRRGRAHERRQLLGLERRTARSGRAFHV